jgi:opacity protein-like surface antigen
MLAAVNMLCFFTVGNAMADDVEKKANYAQLKLGAFQPTGDLDDAGFDAGGVFAIAYDRYLTPYLVVEAAAEGFASENDFRGSNAAAGNFKQENTLVAGAFLLTLIGEIPVGPVSLFGGFGGGIYSVTLDSDIDSTRLGEFSTDDTDTVFGAHVVAGANYDITSRFFLGVEGKYRWTDDVDMDEIVASVPVEYSGNLSGYSVTFNAGFRF